MEKAERPRPCSRTAKRDEVVRRPPLLCLLCLPYRVAHVRDAYACDHRRVAEDGWRARKVVEEPNPGAKQHRRDIDVKFVEESSIQQLLDGVGTVDRNR